MKQHVGSVSVVPEALALVAASGSTECRLLLAAGRAVIRTRRSAAAFF
jgi:hypothetical protein